MQNLDSGEQATAYFFKAVPQLNEIEAAIPVFSFIPLSKQRDTTTQFELLRQLTDTKRHKILLHRTSAEERVLNRYRDEKIFDHSRVKLNKKIEDRFKDIDYINANIVFDQPYKMILTQGPKPGTIKDFYMMLRQEKTEYVVMLCNLKQQGKTKCENYFTGFNEYKLVETQEISSNIIVRTLKDFQNNFTFKHIHYTGWDDHSIPEKYEDITTIIDLIDTGKGVTIHCSAGIGRSGTLAVIMKCISEIQNGKVSVFGNARKIRENRYGSIKNSHQYEFIYDYLRSYIENKKNIQ